MKIAIISRSWFTETKGGAERYIYELSKELIGRNHEVVTVSRQDSDLHNEHVKVWSPSITIVGSAVFSYLGSRQTRKRGPAVTIVNQYWAEMAPLYLEMPTIIILHDVGLFESEIAQRQRIRHFFRKRTLEKVVEKANKIVVPSRLTFDQLVEYLEVPREKIFLIPEGVDLETFRPSDREYSDSRILCTGRFSPNKGQKILIEAFKELVRRTGWEGELYLVGHFTEKAKGYFNELERMADERIKILTDSSDDELALHYQQADICVFPSVSDEGWGLTVAEAFASGKPVICSDIFVETGVATEERAVIVPRGDVEGLTEAMDTLIHSPELRGEIARKGSEYARNLNWKTMANEIERIIQDVVTECNQ